MSQVNVLEAKNNLSKMLRELELGQEEDFVIARNGTPVARLVPYKEPSDCKRIGVAKDVQFTQDDWDIDECNEEIAALFGAE